MKIKKVVGLEHSFNGHDKYKLITYLTPVKTGFMSLTTSLVKKRILYTYDPDKEKKTGNPAMFFLNNDKEVERELKTNEYEQVAILISQYSKTLEVNKAKEKESEEVTD